MSKKVIKSSNKNEKYNLKSVLDTDNIMSGVNLKVVTTIGCASVIASCDNKEPKGNENKNTLKWEDFKACQDKFEKGKEDFDKFVSKCKEQGFSADKIKEMIENLDKQEVQNVLDGKEIKEENGKITIDGKVIDLTKTKPETDNTFSNFNNLSKEQKATLEAYGITNQETLDEFFKIPDNEGFKNKKISELFNEKDIKDETLKNKLEAYKNSKEDNEVKEILKLIMSDADINLFLNYVKYINDKLENIQNLTFNDIKANKGKEKELKDKIKKFCEKYVSDNKINYGEISKIKNIILINSIKEDIKAKLEEGQNVDNLTFTYSKGDNCIKLKIVHKDDKNKTKSVELEIQFESEELLKLKEKEDKEIQLYRIKDGEEGIKYNIDDTKTTEIKNLFPKKKDETAMNKIKATIKSELEKSLKDNNNDVKIDSFANVAKVLKPLITTAKKLNTGKINANGNDEWIYENISSVNDLEALFGGTQGEYVKAVTAEYNAIIKKINDDLGKVTSGELSSNAKKSVDLQLAADGQKTSEGKKIVEAINECLKQDGTVIKDYWVAAGPAQADGTAAAAVKAEITFDNDGKVTKIVMPTTAETITGGGLVLFLEATPNTTKIKAVMTALEAKLQDFINGTNNEPKVQFVSDDTEKRSKKISDFISNDLTYTKINEATFAITSVEETALKNICGVGNSGISTNDDVKTNIVEPLMKKVFGDAVKVKALFNEINNLSGIKVGKSDDNSTLLYCGAGGSLAKISQNDNNGKTGDTVDAAVKMVSPDALKKQVIEIGKKLKECQDDSSSQAFRDLLEEYFGIGGKGKTLQAKVTCAQCLDDNEEWTKLGKLLKKWLFVKNTTVQDTGWTGNSPDNTDAYKAYKKKQLEDYNDSALGLAQGILFKGKNVQQQNVATNKDDKLLFWETDNAAAKIDLGTDDGIGGKNISDSDHAGTGKKVDFDNMIWCQSLPSKHGDVICINKRQNTNNWTNGDILVFDTLKNNIDNNVNFIYILLSLGLVKKDDSKVVGELAVTTKGGETNKFTAAFGDVS